MKLPQKVAIVHRNCQDRNATSGTKQEPELYSHPCPDRCPTLNWTSDLHVSHASNCSSWTGLFVPAVPTVSYPVIAASAERRSSASVFLMVLHRCHGSIAGTGPRPFGHGRCLLGVCPLPTSEPCRLRPPGRKGQVRTLVGASSRSECLRTLRNARVRRKGTDGHQRCHYDTASCPNRSEYSNSSDPERNRSRLCRLW